MAQINWSLLQNDPAQAQARGYSYADQIAKAAGSQAAGQKFAAGDYKGAAADLAQTGDIQGALKLQGVQQQQEDLQTKRTQAVYSYIGQAIPVFQAVAQQHASDPDGGAAAIGQAFDRLAPEISQLTGHNDEALAALRQNLVTDPQGTLTRIQAMVPREYSFQKDGSGRILAIDKATGQQHGEPIGQPATKAPTVHTFTEGDRTVDKQFNPETGQWEMLSSGPRYKPQSAGNGLDGGTNELSPNALDLQVDTYIASRGSILPQFGYGKAGGAHRDKFYNRLSQRMDEQGVTANDIASGKAAYKADSAALSQISKMRSSVQSYEQTVQKNMGILESLLGRGAPQGSAPLINRWIQAGRRSLQGDPDVSAYDTAIKTVTAEYAKVMSGGTGSAAASSDSAREEAESLLNNAQTPPQVRAVLATMRREMANRIEAIKAQEGDLHERLSNRATASQPQTQKVRVFNPATGRLE